MRRRSLVHLAKLPPGRCWSVFLVPALMVHAILVLTYSMLGHDEHVNALIARPSCREAAQLGCSGKCCKHSKHRYASSWALSAHAEVVVSGMGSDPAWRSLLPTKPSVSHSCAQWSTMPLQCHDCKQGWRMCSHEAQCHQDEQQSPGML